MTPYVPPHRTAYQRHQDLAMRQLCRRRGPLVERRFYGRPLASWEERDLASIDIRLGRVEMERRRPGLGQMESLAVAAESLAESIKILVASMTEDEDHVADVDDAQDEEIYGSSGRRS